MKPNTSNNDEHDIKYLDEKFPKGNKQRGEAMVLVALAREQGYAKALDDVTKIIGKQVEWFNGIEDLEDNKLTLKVLDIIRLDIAKLAKEKTNG